MHQSPDSLAGPCACSTLRKAARAVSRVYDHALSETGLTTAQFSILRHIARVGELPLSRLADALVMDRTSLYRALGPMTREGWVTIADQPSGRTKIASLTEAGHAVMEGAAGCWEQAQSRLVGALGAERWSDLEAALQSVIGIAAPGASQGAEEER
jgi:DNA-binding MarR family transcriptional regulator